MRRAVDTNILVRLLVVDDIDQSARAADLVAGGPCDVETSVIMETEWVLRGVLRLDREAIGALLLNLLGLENIRFLERERVVAAAALHREGMDFADALHLIGTGDRDELVTFDRAFAKAAKRLRTRIAVRLL